MREETDLLVEMEGYCFLCLNKIPTRVPLFKLEPQVGLPIPTELSTPAIYSLQYFSRFLKMDMSRVFSTNEPISPDLLAKVERAKLKVELCEECASQIERFSELCRQLEKIEMEIGFYMKIIHGKLAAAESDQLSRSAQSSKFLGKLEIVNALRDEATKQCITKLDEMNEPRVKVENKSKRQLNLERLKIKVRSRSNSYTNQRKCFITHDPVDTTKPKLDHVKLEAPCSPSNSFTNVDNDDDLYPAEDSNIGYLESPKLPSVPLDADVDEKTVVVSASKIPYKVDSQSRRNPKTGKYKCEICCKEFSGSNNFLAHYRSIHLKTKYKCSLCGKTFAQQSGYIRHNRTAHIGVRLRCKGCGKTFSRKEYLANHQRKIKCFQGRTP